MSDSRPITVLGGGSFGTALIKILNDNGRQVVWYVREPEGVDHIRSTGSNPHYLTSVVLNTEILQVTSSIIEAIEGSDTIIIAIP